MDVDGENIEKLTSNTFDTQIITHVGVQMGKVTFAESGPMGILILHYAN